MYIYNDRLQPNNSSETERMPDSTVGKTVTKRKLEKRFIYIFFCTAENSNEKKKHSDSIRFLSALFNWKLKVKILVEKQNKQSVSFIKKNK